MSHKPCRMSLSWVEWPSLVDELNPHHLFLEGRILNAGCGHRPVYFPKAHAIVGADMTPGPCVDVVCDLEAMPFKNEEFDGIVNIAVLEHCRRPWKVVDEFNRVLKPNGKIICTVPFLQPIHYVPTDYYRFTPDGLSSLFEDRNFKIVKLEVIHSVFHSVGWVLEEATKNMSNFWKTILYPVSKVNRYFSKAKKSVNVHELPSAVTILAIKNEAASC